MRGSPSIQLPDQTEHPAPWRYAYGAHGHNKVICGKGCEHGVYVYDQEEDLAMHLHIAAINGVAICVNVGRGWDDSPPEKRKRVVCENAGCYCKE